MGFWDSLGKGLASAASSAEAVMVKKICEGDPIQNGPRKVEQIILLIRRGNKDEELHEQRIKQLRIVMHYLKNQAVSDREAEDAYRRIMSRYGSDLSKLGVR